MPAGLCRKGAALSLGVDPSVARDLRGQVGNLEEELTSESVEAVVRLSAALGGPVVKVPLLHLRCLLPGTPIEALSVRGVDVAERLDNSLDFLVVGDFVIEAGRGGQYEVQRRNSPCQKPTMMDTSCIRPSRLLNSPLGLTSSLPSAPSSPGKRPSVVKSLLVQDLLVHFHVRKGELRTVHMHLPATFGKEGAQAKWPVLFFLPGKGGGSFFSDVKKTKLSEGRQFAAERFVVISLDTNQSNWKELPEPWCGEVIRHFASAGWCDRSRLYLTGNSLGGMSTFEIASNQPDLFAAVAPVAAYHTESRRDAIAQALRSTPIYVVQSTGDECCQYSKEVPLWEALVAAGNTQLQQKPRMVCDHCAMFKEAYDSDTSLYHFLLMHRKEPAAGQ